MIILVTGGRDYKDRAVIASALSQYSQLGNILINGGATGADYLAREYWHKTAELPYITFPAPWTRVGKPAGMMRNIAMLRGNAIAPHGGTVPNVVLAFPGGKGTEGCVREAGKLGIEVVRYG